MKRWRLGIIGCGWAGEQHMRAMRQLPERAELCALSDVDQERVESTAREWGVPVARVDYRALLDRDLLDAVSLCLPHQLHASAAIAAAEAGLHVLVEKPLATTLAEADGMIDAAAAYGVQLMVAENTRFDATAIRAADLIRSGALGDLFLVRISREHQMHDYLRQRPWFLQETSGGIMVSGGVHDFELLRMLAGEVEHVYGLAGHKVLEEMVADDTSVALAGMQDGAAAVLVESFSLRTSTPGVHASVHGSQGSLWFHGDRLKLYTAAQDGHPERVEEIVIPARDTFQAEIVHFLDCLDSGREPLTSGREERKPLAAVLATYASMKQSERIYLAAYEHSTC
jgi:predicted dehydrogenase